jgi:hypothetical protein
MYRYILSLFLFGSICLVPLATPARAAEALQVLAVDPTPGVELIGAEPLYIIFDQSLAKHA